MSTPSNTARTALTHLPCSTDRLATTVVFALITGLDQIGVLRTFVRVLSGGCVRTASCILVAAVTEAGPTTASAQSVTRLRLCPNTRRSWVPVVTQENYTCPTNLGRAALCGSSTPTYPNNSTSLTGAVTTDVTAGTQDLPLDLYRNHRHQAPITLASLTGQPTPKAQAVLTRLSASKNLTDWALTGPRCGGRSTSAPTVVVAPIRCRVLTGGF